MGDFASWKDMPKLPAPTLEEIEQVSSGWVNKYILHYKMPRRDAALEQSGTEARQVKQGSAAGQTKQNAPTGQHEDIDSAAGQAKDNGALDVVYESVSRKGLPEYRKELDAIRQGADTDPDAICIVPVMPNGSLLMIREFRYPLNSWCMAFPAGLWDAGDTLKQAIGRELREEVGCRMAHERSDAMSGVTEAAATWRDVVNGKAAIATLPQAGYSTTGLSEERVQVVFVKAERYTEAEPEPNELIEPFVLPRCDIRAFLDGNSTPIGTRAQLILEMVDAL